MSKMISEEPDFRVTEDLDSPLLPNSYKSAIQLVTKAALNSEELTNKDFEKLLQEGFTEEEVQELMAQADLVNMLNTLATISGIKIDNELTEAEY